MVLRLSRHLELPLRERNQLLIAAGFAPTYRESGLTDEGLAPVREALEFLLAKHEPYPTVVLDRYWDIRLANHGAEALIARVAPTAAVQSPVNVMRLLFDPALGATSAVLNPREVMPPVLRRLRDESQRLDADQRQRDFYAHIASLAPQDLEETDGAHPLLPLHLRMTDGVEVRLYTAITTLGTPADVTLQELRIETYFPADSASTATLKAMQRA